MAVQAPTSPPFVRRVLVVVGIVVAAVVVLLFLRKAAFVLLLFFTATVFALFLTGLARLIRDHTPLSRPWALGLAGLLLVGFFVGAGFLIGPSVSQQFNQLTQTIPNSIGEVRSRLEQYGWGQWVVSHAPSAQQVASSSSSDVLGQITGIFSTALSVLANLFVIVFAGIYLAIAPKLYVNGALHLVPKSRRDRVREVLEAMGHAVRRWVTGRLLSQLVVGVLTTVGLWIIGMPLALALGLVAALLTFIPNLGPVLAIIPAVLVALTEGGNMVAYVVALYLGVQFVESYLITPLIQQHAVSIPPALLITVQILLGLWAGVLGLLMATPLTVVVLVAIQMLYIEDVLGDDVEVMGDAEAWVEEEEGAEG